MTRRYVNAALVYALMAMALGVFYREYTKFSGFAGKTDLAVMHTHYFLLGMVFFLLLALLEKSFGFSGLKNTGKVLVTYHIGLNITGAGLFLRGLAQVAGNTLSKAMDASISGISGLGHILLSVSMIMLLLRIRKQAA